MHAVVVHICHMDGRVFSIKCLYCDYLTRYGDDVQ